MEEKTFYSTYNNYKLCGVLNKVNGDNEIVVICHARTSSKDSRPTTKLANRLTENKINNFRFDFISCGESDGDYNEYTITNMLTNLNDTLALLKEKYNFENFILIGCSMGGRIVSLVDTNKFNINKIILWYGAIDYGRGLLNIPSKKEKQAKKNGYYPINNGWKLSYEYFVDERKYRSYKTLSKLSVPLLFVHGTFDPYVTYKSSVNTSKKCKNAKLVLINGGDHGFHNEEHMNIALDKTISFIINNN
ncbi:MAG: alpha/beta hydrolase [Bacilli bacterium]|nr:alpha/beta hydrolase [Bacilli bacterium]MDD4808433.1 alpha/beta hydrolase [Bacilli bacterium]